MRAQQRRANNGISIPDSALDAIRFALVRLSGQWGGPSIRATLVALVVLCVLPISLVASLLFVSFYEHEKLQLSKNAINRAQGFVLAVDREFAATPSALLAHGTSQRLATGDLEGFHRRAVEVLANVRAERILVLDRSGQILLSTHRPYGDPLPKVPNPLILEQILQTGKPGVSDLFVGPITNQRIFTVGVPVRHDDTIVYSLNATFTHQQFMALLQAQGFPENLRVAITDSTNSIVARSHEIDKFLGKPVAPELLARMKSSNEGSMESITLDGVPVLTGFSRSSFSHWGVAVGIPKTELTAGLRRTLYRLVLATIGALCIGVWLAWFVGGEWLDLSPR